MFSSDTFSRRHEKTTTERSVLKAVACLGWIFLFVIPAMALAAPVDTLWKTVHTSAGSFEVRVVSDGALGGGFPGRALSLSLDGSKVKDLYAVDLATGQAADLSQARLLVSLAQSSFKWPSPQGVTLNSSASIDAVDVQDVSAGYPLWTSFYFDEDFVNDFVRQGISGGLNDAGRRAELYRQILVDMILQPDLADSPGAEKRYQTMLDASLGVQEWNDALGSGLEAFERGGAAAEITWDAYRNGVGALSEHVDRFYDLKRTAEASPLDRLAEALDVVNVVTSITADTARLLLLHALANERALVRIELLEAFVSRDAPRAGFDPALADGLAMARADIEVYVDAFYRNIPEILAAAAGENGGNVVTLAKFSKYAVQRFWGKAAAATFAHVLEPYFLSYEVYQGIRNQEDRARTASLAATLQRRLYADHGLRHHRDRMETASGLDGDEAQAFFELYQMSWYLAARHYQDTLTTLNNRLTRFFGKALDIFFGVGYEAQMEELSRLLENRRVVALRLAPTCFLATVPDPFSDGRQAGECSWLMGLVRSRLVATPTPRTDKNLDLCITLPFDPAGTPATLENVHIRFEPAACGAGAGSWECGPGDPDGECSARVRLFWDDDTNSANADCAAGHGPCPISGAEDLHPVRDGLFLWQPAADGLRQGDYRIYATLEDGEQSATVYSEGFYEFIDPLWEPDGWRVVAREVSEGFRSDGDGIPETGEEVDILLLLQNTSGRPLQNAKIRRLGLTGDAVRHLTTEDFDETIPENQDLSYVFDGETLVPDAGVGDIVTASDDFNVWVGRESGTRIGLVAWIEYADPAHPVDPHLRRLQEIGFEIEVSGGDAAPALRCDHVDLVSENDGDGVFESGETGHFTATLCNDGDWEAREVRQTFVDPPPFGRWIDEDSSYPDLNPSECQPSADDFALRLERHECGSVALAANVAYLGGGDETSCTVNVACAPYQSIQDEAEAGTVAPGETATASVRISNPGAAPLVITSVVETSAAADTTVPSFPSSLAPGAQGEIEVAIETSSLAAGRSSRTLRVSSNSNNADERESVIHFGVRGGGAAEQITTGGVSSGPVDVSGSRAVFERSSDIYVVDLLSREETRLTSTPDREYNPRIDGDLVVFARDNGNPDLANVILHDLAASQETAITDLAVAQRDPDVHGNVIVWEDRRAGATEADVYRYIVGSSAVNGERLVELGSRRAATDPRIIAGFVAYAVRHYFDPADDFTFRRDFGYYDRAAETTARLGLDVAEPLCSAGNLFDVGGGDLVFECDCRSDCDRDDMIYRVDMSSGSSPVRLTCDAGLGNDREEPLVFGGKVLYKLDGADDLYEVSVGNGCQTEVPLEVGAQVSQRPAGDVDFGAYVFQDNRSGLLELWGVVPPPPIEAAVTSFSFLTSTFFQESSYDFEIVVRNNGTASLSDLPVAVEADGLSIFGTTIAALAPGETTTRGGTWSTVGATVGEHVLCAALAPAPPGDADPTNDERCSTLDVLDDDETAPVVSMAEVVPAPGDDGDAFLETGEDVLVRFNASDPKGVASAEVTISDASTDASPVSGDVFEATIQNPGAGVFAAEITATDADDSPASSLPIAVGFEVFPARPEVIATVPAAGEVGVDPRIAVEVMFSVDMNPASITAETVFLAVPGNGVVNATLTYDGTSRGATLQTAATLAPRTIFEIHVLAGSTGVLDVRDNELLQELVSTFTTSEPPMFADGFESGSLSRWSRVVGQQ